MSAISLILAAWKQRSLLVVRNLLSKLLRSSDGANHFFSAVILKIENTPRSKRLKTSFLLDTREEKKREERRREGGREVERMAVKESRCMVPLKTGN